MDIVVLLVVVIVSVDKLLWEEFHLKSYELLHGNQLLVVRVVFVEQKVWDAVLCFLHDGGTDG